VDLDKDDYALSHAKKLYISSQHTFSLVMMMMQGWAYRGSSQHIIIRPEGAIECISDRNPYEIDTKHPDHGQSGNYSDIRSMVVIRHSRLSSLQSYSGHDQGAEKVDRKGGKQQNQPAALGRMWRW